MNKRIRKKKAKQQLIRAISGLVEAAEEMQREQERRTRQAGISYIKYIEAVRERQYGIMPVYTPLFEKEQYCDMVEKAKHHIKEGDIFQIVLSNRLSAPFEGSLLIPTACFER